MEMMIVVSAIGIIMAIAVPSFSRYLRRTRVAGSSSQLMADIYFARSLAIAQRKTIMIQFTDSNYQIVDTTDGSVERTREAPAGITFATTGDPNFYAWGLADATDITIAGSSWSRIVNLLPTGSVSHASY
jgi:Tfp pilus assembly protein FimT